MTAPLPGDPVQAALEHHRAGRVEQAEALYRQALAHNPNDIRALHMLGTALVQRRQPALAVEPLRRAAQIAPMSPDVAFAFGEALRLSGDAPAAEQAYRKSLTLRPLYPQ